MENPFDAGYFETPELRTMGFGSIGENVAIAKNCNIVGLENISIGDNVRIDGNTHIIATGPVVLGSYIHIGAHCHLAGRGGIELCDFAGLSQGVRIYSASDDYSGAAMTNPTVPARYTNASIARVCLGQHCIVGSGSVILPGCEIGEGVAVGALSLVNRSLEPWGICCGNPARRVKGRSMSALRLASELTARTLAA